MVIKFVVATAQGVYKSSTNACQSNFATELFESGPDLKMHELKLEVPSL